MSEQQIKAMIITNIIDNCTIELDNTGQERYSLNQEQFGKCVDTLVRKLPIPAVSKCDCTPDETTGTTTVKCCNICGKPAESFWRSS